MKKNLRYMSIIGSFWIGIIIMSSMFAIGIYQLNVDYTIHGWVYTEYDIVNGVDIYEKIDLRFNLIVMIFILFIDVLLVLGLYYASIYEVFTRYGIPITNKHIF